MISRKPTLSDWMEGQREGGRRTEEWREGGGRRSGGWREDRGGEGGRRTEEGREEGEERKGVMKYIPAVQALIRKCTTDNECCMSTQNTAVIYNGKFSVQSHL